MRLRISGTCAHGSSPGKPGWRSPFIKPTTARVAEKGCCVNNRAPPPALKLLMKSRRLCIARFCPALPINRERPVSGSVVSLNISPKAIGSP